MFKKIIFEVVVLNEQKVLQITNSSNKENDAAVTVQLLYTKKTHGPSLTSSVSEFKWQWDTGTAQSQN
jgi:hypothetical protein